MAKGVVPRGGQGKGMGRGFFSLGDLRLLAAGRVPGQAVIQFTDRCNASCVQCGMRAAASFSRSTLRVDDVKRLLDSMAEQGIAAVSFTGGEPLLFLDQVLECARHAARAGIRHIRTGTNGFLFRGHDQPGFADRMEHLAEALAASPLSTFWISLDSADPAVHERNRGLPGVVAGIAKALPVLHSWGVYASANLGINRRMGGAQEVAGTRDSDGAFDAQAFGEACREAFRLFYRAVEDMGFTIVNACYPMSEESGQDHTAAYAATASDSLIRFSGEEKAVLFRALYEVVPEFRSRLRIFTPRSALLALARQHGGDGSRCHPCRGGRDFFFVDARTMDAYPCGYRGSENLGKFWDLDVGSLPEPPACVRCDWECFRDPSELAGPVLDLLRRPARLVRRLLRDQEHFRVWLQDLAYYRACGWFNGRTPPDYVRLARFA